MRLEEPEIKEIQRLFLEGTPIREIAKCYQRNEATIRYHCAEVSLEPVRRLERAEILYLIYVRTPMQSEVSIESLYDIAAAEPETFPRLSRMSRNRFTQVVSSCVAPIGWNMSKRSGKCYGFNRPEESKVVMIEW